MLRVIYVDLKDRSFKVLDKSNYGRIAGADWSPDGQWVVSASADRTLKVWELSTGDLLTTFTADAYLWCCAFAPDGLTIVSGDQVGSVHFLRVEKGDSYKD